MKINHCVMNDDCFYKKKDYKNYKILWRKNQCHITISLT